MLTVNFLRVIGCEHDAEKKLRTIGTTTEMAR